jgi:hypothetical protein
MKDTPDTLVPLSETLAELASPGLRALAERLSEHLVVTEHGSGIPADVERRLLAVHRTGLTILIAAAMASSVARPGSLIQRCDVDVGYVGYLPPEGAP